MNEEQYWQAVLNRDPHADGTFVYAVRSTGIYCRPSCPSRRPKRAQVVFFSAPAEAEQAGFRSCRRCKPQEAAGRASRPSWVEDARLYIERNLDESPTLETIAAAVNVSPYHLQRTFKGVMGMSPRQYAEMQRVQRFKTQVKNGGDVTTALYEAGFSSSSRLYERASVQLGMTPAAYRRGGLGMQINYTIVDSLLGKLLVAATDRGICSIGMSDSDIQLESSLRAEYPAAEICRDDGGLRQWVEEILKYLAGRQQRIDVPLDVQATAFQRLVWEALQMIPFGSTRTYGEVAQALGNRQAARAVARACATNPVALVIPCHRVVREDGELGGYRWGLERKKRLLAQEQSMKDEGWHHTDATDYTEKQATLPCNPC